jgi:hypothetical protein
MDIKKLTQEVLLKNMTPEQQMAVLESVQASVQEAKAVQKQKIAENVDLVLVALKRIEADMLKRVEGSAKVIEDRVKTIKDGKDGKNGIDGKAGRDGKDGKNGSDGRNGKDGLNGVSGERGQDGVGVQDAHIDFDGCLIISLTNGQELNVGEVVPFDVAEKIKVIGNGGGTSQYVLDALAALQTAIDNFEALPSQTGNAGKFLSTNGTTASWASVAGGLSYQGTWNATSNTPTLASGTGTNGYYYIVATAGSTNLDGLTDWQIGDWLLFNGTNWQKIDQTNLVTSVAGRTGAVTLSNTDISGLGTMSTQNASSVAVTGGTIDGTTIGGTTPAVITGSTINANTKVVSPDFYAQSVLGGNLRTYTGTSLLNWDGGGSGNITVNGGLTASPANKNITLSPTGTGTVTINPATASSMDNVVIGATTAKAITGTTITASTYAGGNVANWNTAYGWGNHASAGYYLASNPSGYTNNTGTVTSVGGTGTVNGLSLSGTVTTSGSLTLGGTLDLSSPPAIGGTTPASVTGTAIVASNGILVNSATVSSNYTIATGTNGFSVGPLTINSGVTVTVASGQRHVVI